MTLDIEMPDELHAYLRNYHGIGDREKIVTRTISGGVSGRTVMVAFEDGRTWVVKQALPKLRVAAEWYCDPRRIEREALGLRRLSALAPPGAIAKIEFEDKERQVLGMQAVPQPHDNWKTLLLSGNVDLDLVRQFGELLAGIHAKSSEEEASLASEFADRSYFESLRLEPYYAYAATQQPDAATFLEELIADTLRRSHCLVHGDYSPKNILVHCNRLTLVDHEVIHWGEPAFDVGFALTHFLSKAHRLRQHRRALADASRAYWRVYRAGLGCVSWGADLETRVVNHTLACLLARAAGRSPLEYLADEERGRQIAAVISLMSRPPAEVDRLIDGFLERIATNERN